MKLADYPRPNIKELPGLYAELDNLIQDAEIAIRGLPERLFNRSAETINFGEMTENEFHDLIGRNPDVMVIAFTRVCGLSDREFSRLFRLENVYRLRESWQSDREGANTFVKAMMQLLPEQMRLETFLYTFFRMWEEHQKRHHRARFEEDVRTFFRTHGYECRKITHPTEVNGAIPPENPLLVMQVRTGVRKDLVKRAKEFSSEFDKSIEAFANAKFMIVFKIPYHELDRRDEIREVIMDQRKGKKPYDMVLFQDELEDALKKLEEWGVPKSDPLQLWSVDVKGKTTKDGELKS
jgi:hypothetical protein